MKFEILLDNQHLFIQAPPDACFTGLTVRHKGQEFSIVSNGNRKLDCRHQDMVLDENTTLIFHHYTSPKFLEILEKFAGFEGMKCYEIHKKGLHIYADP
ncbi:MAG: hypothetical protein IJW40_07780 [Clostridia bacterium]|nr:hypothetical protein [Clostridia bacterium]